MNSPAAELQKAIFARLEGDAPLKTLLGGAKVYDQAPAHTPFPYVTFGRIGIHDWSTGTERGTEQIFSIHVWSKARGKREVHAIMETVRGLLDDADLSLAGHALVNMRLDYSEIRHDDDLAVNHGTMRFRAVTEALD